MTSDGLATRERKPEFIVREAMRSEIPQIVELARAMFYESSYGLNGNATIDTGKFQRTLENYWRYQSAQAIVAMDARNGDVLGYVMIYYQRDFTVEPVGELYQFYVRADMRKTLVPRELAKAATKQFDAWGCVHSYVECGTGFDDGGKSIKTFGNLWGKVGFKQVGAVFIRE